MSSSSVSTLLNNGTGIFVCDLLNQNWGPEISCPYELTSNGRGVCLEGNTTAERETTFKLPPNPAAFIEVRCLPHKSSSSFRTVLQSSKSPTNCEAVRHANSDSCNASSCTIYLASTWANPWTSLSAKLSPSYWL